MSDVTNPGLVSVASEVDGNPDPNGGTATWAPRELDKLIPVADAGHSLPPDGGVDASLFPTPKDVGVDGGPILFPVLSAPVPPATEFDVAKQLLGEGSMQPIDPGNLSAGYRFVGPAEFTVVGPAESFQTNATDQDDVVVAVTITAVYDADHLFQAPSATTTRYYLVTAPPSLTSYPVSLLGRQVTFADDTTTAALQGVSRFITAYGGNFIVIDKQDVDGSLLAADPVAGDVFDVATNRQGSQQVNTPGGSVDVFILPPPPAFVPNPAQSLHNLGNVLVANGLVPIITSGTNVPTAKDVNVPDECAVVGLPKNVFV